MSLPWNPKFNKHDINILNDEQVFSGFSTIRSLRLTFPLFRGGMSQEISRELICRPRAVAVLLYDPDTDKVVMIEQLRVGALSGDESPWLLEIVAGLVEPNQSPEETAHRESWEETGCEVLSLIPMFSCYSTPGAISERLDLFCGRVNAPLSGALQGLHHEGEDIKVHVFSTEEAYALLQAGKIISSPAILALQWLKLNKGSIKFS